MATSSPLPKPKRRKAADRVRVTVYLDEPLASWGKQQEGGLSELLRRLLEDAWDEQGRAPGAYPPELIARYHELVDKKLANGLTLDDELALASVCEEIDAWERSSPGRRQRDAAVAALDRELAELRSLLQAFPVKTDVSASLADD